MTISPRVRLIEIDARQLQPLDECVPPPLVQAADCLAAAEVVTVRFHPRALPKAVVVQHAEVALCGIRRVLVERHALPDAAYVEIDDESRGVPVAPFHKRRFLLPHQDGGHCSFLTPSQLHCPDLLPEDRLFSSSVYWRRPSHKMYQGFLVTRTGEPAGETYYYNAVGLLRLAYARRHGRLPVNISQLARFCLENIRQSKALQPIHASRYLVLGALLGSPEPAHHTLPSGPRAESEFWPAQYTNIPGLSELADTCPCGVCDGPGARLICNALDRTLGLSWPRVRFEYEARVTAGVHDLLLANNLTFFHAAESQATRTIVPMCIVVQDPSGVAYERWLAEQWQTASVATEPVYTS
jgi:hypothetical protein